MAKKKIGLILISVVLLALVVIFCIARKPETVNTKIVLSGGAGIEVTGSYTADGKEYNIKETLPAKLSIDAGRLSLLLESSRETAAISAEVLVNDRPRVSRRHQNIQIEVTGNTMFSATPRTHLKAFSRKDG